MISYPFKSIEKKWQKIWGKEGIYTADDGFKKPKKYILAEFPYPSGEGLHMGHLRPYTAGDVYSRFLRMNGYEVMYPMGWDAFGLPAENYAIKKGIHPSISTAKNISNAKTQLKNWGIGFDWSRELNTTDPDYYKWTQWLFLQFFKAGLAYEAEGLINWCPKDKTGLANEEVIGGCCERCGTPVEKKKLRQWYLKITAYAEKLLKGLEKLDWPERIKLQQINWIGKSEGAEVEFPIANLGIRKVVLMHGKDTNPSQKWYPWLVKEVEKRNISILAPFLPEPPEIGTWVKEIEKTRPDENTTLVGHSRGGVAILRWLENLPKGKRVKKVILVATNRGDDKKSYGRFFEKPYNFKRIKSHCDSFTVLHSKDDEWVPFSAGEYLAKDLGAEFLVFSDRGHFGKKLPKQEIPEIVDQIFPSIKVFTTRPDTLFGATYMVLAPEHPLIKNLEFRIQNLEEVKKYIKKAKAKSEEERIAEGREKTGVELKGIKAVNPATKEEIPVWVADYVLLSYGTGAIMAVPAHDQRDFEFAKKYKLPVKQVIAPYFSTNEGKDAIREDKQTVRRKTAYAFLWDRKNNRYLCLDWKKFGWHSGIIGGLETDEDYIKAAKREIREETGYRDVKFVKYLAGEVHNHFFAAHKDVNRYAVGRGMLFELASDKKEDVAAEHLKHHKPVWIAAEKMRDWLNLENFKYMWQVLEEGKECFIGNGAVINSGKFSGMPSEKAKWEITKFVGGKRKVQYRLRDWVFSRQRYWGEPIPLIHCVKCALRDPSGQGVVPVPEKDLPVILPPVKNYKPTGTGESPLAAIKSWVNVKCPKCNSPAKRETNTMPQWAGSSWYYLRYCDPENKKEFAGQKLLKCWLPVDVYFGGMEHTTLHLLYSRFWHLFLYDKKLVPVPEPYAKRVPHGIILGPDGEKMSKSRGNVVNPDEIVKKFGADCLRMYELFLGPHEATVSWNPQGILGISRFLERIYKKFQEHAGEKISKDTEQAIHRAVKKIEDDILSVKFNTAVSALMICLNEIESQPLSKSLREMFLKILAPFAPHLSEELWQELRKKTRKNIREISRKNSRRFASIHLEKWPKYDERLIEKETFTLIIQINGKVRDSVEAPVDLNKKDAEILALECEKIKNIIGSSKPKKIIYVPNRLINIVV